MRNWKRRQKLSRQLLQNTSYDITRNSLSSIIEYCRHYNYSTFLNFNILYNTQLIIVLVKYMNNNIIF